MSVHWTDAALQQLRAIYDYSEQIAAFPLSGRTVPEYAAPQVREIIEGQYHIIYHIKPDQIDVVAVIHGARQIN